MTSVLGLNAFHGDAAACLIVDGRLVAAAEEERFRRVKHCAGFPREAARWCLARGGLALSDLDHVAVNQDARANIVRKLAYLVKSRPDVALVMDRLRNRKERAALPETLARELGGRFAGETHFVEHHLAHLGSAYLASPFDEALAVSIDGFGDFASAAWGMGRGAQIDVDERVYFPHSLGIFYQALTQFLGFDRYGDEYKVMGLAPYGEPAYLDALRRVVRPGNEAGFRLDLAFFRHSTERIEHEWEGGEPTVGRLFTPRLEELLGEPRAPGEEITQRHRDIACSTQAMYEEAFFGLLRALHARYRVEALALAGGCAMNSVANGRIAARTPFRRLYVQAAAGDAGGAIGAAAIAWARAGGAGRLPMEHAYWGPEFDDGEMRALLDAHGAGLARAGCRVERVAGEAALCGATAAAIAAGAVVGWFQGRMEWGPRALGNRSIVCDPRRADMKEILNAKIKRRESFRPFAPSILREAVPEWFEQDADVPFMSQVLPVRRDKRALVPAVTHVDGSGRLHTVTAQANPRYHRLIAAFRDATGVPMVLNTSFNENEPIVCTPAEALDCFLRTRMDLLVLGDWTVSRG